MKNQNRNLVPRKFRGEERQTRTNKSSFFLFLFCLLSFNYFKSRVKNKLYHFFENHQKKIEFKNPGIFNGLPPPLLDVANVTKFDLNRSFVLYPFQSTFHRFEFSESIR